MPCFRDHGIQPPLLLFSVTLLLFFSTTAYSFSGGIIQSQRLQEKPDSGLIDEELSGGFLPWGTRRSVIEGNGTTNSSFHIFAEHRTYRKDPLNGFKYYTGGWNLKNKHYFASVGFTAVPFFIIAAIWLVVFGICLSCICICCCCHRRPPRYGYSNIACTVSLVFLIIFTIAAIIGSIVSFTGQRKFHGSIVDTMDYVLMQADIVVDNLRNVAVYLASSKNTGLNNVFMTPDLRTKIDQDDAMISNSMGTLLNRATDNSNQIKGGVTTMIKALNILAAVMLGLALVGFLLSVFGMQFLVYILLIIGWILVACTFILCGVFLLLHNAVADTCVAMNEWVQNPALNTVLDDILPCVDNATATESLLRTKQVSYQLVNVVNNYIGNVSNRNFSPNFQQLYCNQSGPLMPLLCNPFFPDMMDRKCVVGEVELVNATQVWKKYVCEVSKDGICTTEGRMTPAIYNQMTASVNVSYGLYRYSPFLVQLTDCTFVQDTLTDISKDHCPGLSRSSKWVYVGLVIMSSSVMFSLIFWIIYPREMKHHVYTKHYDVDHPQIKQHDEDH